ncbi:sortase-associated OmpA-like protein PdsO [Glaciecola sp. 2405UD65-10]|uniref:sortase-associated OmpA-like protein PdsO n=1 Tax=Glaciecola sp. 2405UD65-10 TaxID=3397244 RepID=UPI003B5BCEE7
MMKKLMLLSTITIGLNLAISQSAFASSQVIAKEHDSSVSQEKKNEMIGFGSGALAGATVGGPLGAFIGGIFGLMIADDINTDEELQQNQQTLSQLNHSLREEKVRLATLESDYKELQHQQMMQLVAFDQQQSDAWLNDFSDFETSIQFKTASSSIEQTYLEQLDGLAKLLKTYPQLMVNLTGFADERGDAAYNHSLSLKRADAVKTYLLKNKIKPSQINTRAAGEVTVINTTHKSTQTPNATQAAGLRKPSEELFFDRRVSITLLNSAKHLSAAN